jgi:hypothetical protein
LTNNIRITFLSTMAEIPLPVRIEFSESRYKDDQRYSGRRQPLLLQIIR